MIAVVAIPPWDVEVIVRNFRQLLEKACSRTTHTSLQKMTLEATRREAVLWLVTDDGIPIAGGFTHVALRKDGLRVIEITAMGGSKAKHWIGVMRERLHAYRKAERADLLTIIGRKGWARVLNVKPVGNRDGAWIYEEAK